MKKWTLIIPVFVIALISAWYAFRPERGDLGRSMKVNTARELPAL